MTNEAIRSARKWAKKLDGLMVWLDPETEQAMCLLCFTTRTGRNNIYRHLNACLFKKWGHWRTVV